MFLLIKILQIDFGLCLALIIPVFQLKFSVIVIIQFKYDSDVRWLYFCWMNLWWLVHYIIKLSYCLVNGEKKLHCYGLCCCFDNKRFKWRFVIYPLSCEQGLEEMNRYHAISLYLHFIYVLHFISVHPIYVIHSAWTFIYNIGLHVSSQVIHSSFIY